MRFVASPRPSVVSCSPVTNPSRRFRHLACGLSCEVVAGRKKIPVCTLSCADGVVELLPLFVKLSSVGIGSEVCKDAQESDPQEDADGISGIAKGTRIVFSFVHVVLTA